jgi:hypothetical protein
MAATYPRSSLAISPADIFPTVLVSAGKNPEQVAQNHPEDAVSPAVSNYRRLSCCCYSRLPTVTSRSHTSLLTATAAFT